ncbi:MAG: hypothetical protein HYU41_06810 [Candidatus Rokubacteria bacterium]|nr:hypothetical protein [Candidatus Rokubacteria bacterium]
MKNALLLFLLGLAGIPSGQEPAALPAAAVETVVATPAGTISAVEELLGAWRGQWETAPGANTPVEVVFTQGHRASTVFAYVTLVESSGERTVRRLARLTEGALELAVPGRGDLVLRSDGDARLVAPGVTLVRLRR